MARKVRIGIVGLGSMGRRYLQCVSSMEDVEVAAAVSRPAGQETARQLRRYPSLPDMLERETLDAVCICTPTDLHPRQVRRSLEAGVHVICEKPLALHSADAAALSARAETRGVQLLTAQVVRFAESSRWLREAVRSGRYGPVCEAFFSRLSAFPGWGAGNWFADGARSGLVPFDLHIHDLDLMVHLFGCPQAAACRGSRAVALPFPEHVWFTYDYPGFRVTAEAAWYAAPLPFSASWRVAFGSALALYRDGAVTLYAGGDWPETVCVEPKDGPDMYSRELACFVQCIRENRSPALLPSGEILQVLGLLERMTAEGGPAAGEPSGD